MSMIKPITKKALIASSGGFINPYHINVLVVHEKPTVQSSVELGNTSMYSK
jgi:hypothetical protein